MTLDPRFLSPAGVGVDAARRLLDWLLAHGADEFTVAVMALRGEPAPVADAFEDALAPFELPAAPRRMPGAPSDSEHVCEVRRWALTAESLAALRAYLPPDLFVPRAGPDGWLEDLAIFRGGELLFGVVTHEREAVLRLTAAEHAEVRVLGVASSDAGEGIGF